MNIALHSAYGLLELLAASWVGGIVSAFIYVLTKHTYLIPRMVKTARFPKFGEFVSWLKCAEPRKFLAAVSDYLACVTLVVMLLSSTFIYNSGRFRIISLLFLLIGFALGTKLLSRPILELTILALFVLKWMTDVFIFPIAWVLKLLKGIAAKLLGRIYERCCIMIVKRYTSYRFSGIKKEARYGLLDEYYKEKIK